MREHQQNLNVGNKSSASVTRFQVSDKRRIGGSFGRPSSLSELSPILSMRCNAGIGVLSRALLFAYSSTTLVAVCASILKGSTAFLAPHFDAACWGSFLSVTESRLPVVIRFITLQKDEAS